MEPLIALPRWVIGGFFSQKNTQKNLYINLKSFLKINSLLSFFEFHKIDRQFSWK